MALKASRQTQGKGTQSMAVNIGTAPERWLRGVDRLVAGMANLLPGNATGARRGRRIPAHWVLQLVPSARLRMWTPWEGFLGPSDRGMLLSAQR